MYNNMDFPQSNLNNKPFAASEPKPADNLLGATHAANSGLPTAPRSAPPLPPPVPTRPAMPLASSKPGASEPKPLSTFTPPPMPSKPAVPMPPLPAKVLASEGLPAKGPVTGFPSTPPKPFTFSTAGNNSSVVPKAESKTQAPPASSVNIRSMLSDSESIKTSGGMAPKPETIKLESLEENAPIFAPQTTNQLPGGVVEEGGSRIWAILAQVLGSIVLVVALALIGYYVVYPLIFPAQISMPAIDDMAGVPVAPSGVAIPSVSSVAASHISLFVKSPIAQAKVNLSDLTSLDIVEALQTETKNVAMAGSVKEVAMSKGGSQIPFGVYFGTLLNNFSAEELAIIAEDDFTGFLYYSDKGVWPGYVVKLKGGVSAAAANAVFSKIEVGDIAKLFVAYPGVPDSFKTGPFKSYPIRYAKFSSPGASLNYGILGDFVVISTSFDGFKAVVDLLGL